MGFSKHAIVASNDINEGVIQSLNRQGAAHTSAVRGIRVLLACRANLGPYRMIQQSIFLLFHMWYAELAQCIILIVSSMVFRGCRLSCRLFHSSILFFFTAPWQPRMLTRTVLNFSRPRDRCVRDWHPPHHMPSPARARVRLQANRDQQQAADQTLQ